MPCIPGRDNIGISNLVRVFLASQISCVHNRDCKCNSFQVTTDLLNSDNLKVAIALLCNELQIYNFTMLQLTQKKLNNIFKQYAVNAIVFKFQLISQQ